MRDFVRRALSDREVISSQAPNSAEVALELERLQGVWKILVVKDEGNAESFDEKEGGPCMDRRRHHQSSVSGRRD
jgi:hypothetical protein